MMLKKITHAVLAVSLILLVTAAAAPSPQEKQEKRPKDQQEYEMINKAFGTAPSAALLEVLDQWKAKYAETAYDIERIRLYMASYQAANQGDKAVATAKELLGKVPGDFSGNFTIASLTPFLGKTDAGTFGDGVKASKDLLGSGIAKQFAVANKPAQVSQAQWDDAKKQAQVSAHQTLGWVAMQRKDNKGAESELKQTLGLNGNLGQVSYWLGQVTLAQADPNKNTLAMYSFARAAVHEGTGALPPEGRKQVGDYIKQLYEKFAGSLDGYDGLLAAAKNSALPPPDFPEIKDAATQKAEADLAFSKNYPLRYQFVMLKENLQSAAGDATWGNLKGKLTPKFRLFVVSATPARAPNKLTLTSSKGGAAQVTLNLENRMRAAPGKGTAVAFEGVATTLTKRPFMLVLNDGKIVP